jgi:hypothetical protein
MVASFAVIRRFALLIALALQNTYIRMTFFGSQKAQLRPKRMNIDLSFDENRVIKNASLHVFQTTSLSCYLQACYG